MAVLSVGAHFFVGFPPTGEDSIQNPNMACKHRRMRVFWGLSWVLITVAPRNSINSSTSGGAFFFFTSFLCCIASSVRAYFRVVEAPGSLSEKRYTTHGDGKSHE